jgi:hypothetical protein
MHGAKEVQLGPERVPCCQPYLWERRRWPQKEAGQEVSLPPTRAIPTCNQSIGGRPPPVSHGGAGGSPGGATPPIGHKTGRYPTRTRKDGGQGSGSPLMRAFTGLMISSASGTEGGEVFYGPTDWLGSRDPMTHLRYTHGSLTGLAD